MFTVESIMDNLFHFKKLLWPGEIFKHISYMEIFIEKCYFMYNSYYSDKPCCEFTIIKTYLYY